MTVALIGSRKAPVRFLNLANDIGFILANQGIEMFSGGADGMDSAFEKGYNRANRKSLCNIILPKERFNGRSSFAEDNTYVLDSYSEDILRECDSLVYKLHPHYEDLGDFAMRAHMRNCIQILGHDLESPVDEVICWAPPNGIGVKGGTNTAFRLAMSRGIPCWNLAVREEFVYLEERFNLKENTLDFLF